MKHLQKEVARLEAELRTPDPSTEKDLKIQQVNLPYYVLPNNLFDVLVNVYNKITFGHD